VNCATWKTAQQPKSQRERLLEETASAVFFQLLRSPVSSLSYTSTYLLGNRERFFARILRPCNKKLNRNILLLATVFNSDPYIFVYIFKCDRNV